jgi:hypothetical protein
MPALPVGRLLRRRIEQGDGVIETDGVAHGVFVHKIQGAMGQNFKNPMCCDSQTLGQSRPFVTCVARGGAWRRGLETDARS